MSSDRLSTALVALIRSIFPTIDYLALYPARVIAQNLDGTLELQPDDSRMPGMSSVPIRYGVPGVTAKVSSGARVLLGFAAGDPSKPVAELWESATVTEINLGAATQYAALGTDVRTELDAIWSALQNHVHPGVSAGAASTGAPTVVPVKQTVLGTIVKVK